MEGTINKNSLIININEMNEPTASTSRDGGSVFLMNTSQSVKNCNDLHETRLDIIKERILHIWQQRQILKCMEDNSINTVLDSFLRMHDAANEVGENLFAPTDFEDEALLMAIRAYGLQQIHEFENDVIAGHENQNEDVDDNDGEENEADIVIHDVNNRMEEDEIEQPEIVRREDVLEDFMEAAMDAAIQKKGLTKTVHLSPSR